MKKWTARFLTGFFFLLSATLNHTPIAAQAQDDTQSRIYFPFEAGEFIPVSDKIYYESKALPEGWTTGDPGDANTRVVWTREKIPQANKFLRMKLQPDAEATALSDFFSVQEAGNYLLEAKLRTQGNLTGAYMVTLELYDADKTPLQAVSTLPRENAIVWSEIRSPYFTIPDNAKYGRLILRGLSKNIESVVDFDEIFLTDYNFDFEIDNDQDSFPDNWKRYINPDENFKHFRKNRAYLETEGAYAGDNALRFEIQEGNVAAESLLIPIHPLSSYRCTGRIKTEGNLKVTAHVLMMFYDEYKNLIPELLSRGPSVSGDRFWERPYVFQVDTLDDDRAAFVRLRLVLEANGQINGSAVFDGISFVTQPRIVIEPVHSDINLSRIDYKPERIFVFSHNEPVDFKIYGESLEEGDYTLSLGVVNFWDQEIYRFAGETIHVPLDAPFRTLLPAAFNIQEPGFMQMELTLFKNSAPVAARIVNFGKLQPPLGQGQRKRLGVDLDPFHPEIAQQVRLAQLLQPSLARFPVWYAGFHPDSLRSDEWNRVHQFANRMQEIGADLAGRFDREHLPDSLLDALQSRRAGGLYQLYKSEFSLYESFLRAPMTDLGDKVEWWLLAPDHDASFEHANNAYTLLEPAVKLLEQATPWGQAGAPLPVLGKNLPADIDFVTQTVAPGATWQAVRSQIMADRELRANLERWYSASLPDNRHASRFERIAEYSKQLIELLQDGSARVILPEFENEETGLCGKQLNIKPEYFVTQTVSNLIASGIPQGSFAIAEGMEVRGFDVNGNIIFAVWSDQGPVETDIFLGADLQRIDLMGRTTSVGEARKEYHLVADKTPVFYAGIDKPLLMTKLSVHYDNPKLLSVKAPQERMLVITNHFDTPLHGSIELAFPADWKVTPNTFTFKNLRPGDTMRFPLTFVINKNDTTGGKITAAQLHLQTDESYDVKAQLPVQVGSNLSLDVAYTRIDDQTYEALISFTNNDSRPITFYAEFRIEDTGVSFQRGPHTVEAGETIKLKSYRFPAEHLGKTLIGFAREKTGTRFVNGSYPIVLE